MATISDNYRMTLPYKEYEDLVGYDVTPARHTGYLTQATSFALCTFMPSPVNFLMTGLNLAISYKHRQNRLAFDGCEDPNDNKKTAKPIELVTLAGQSSKLMIASTAANAVYLYYTAEHIKHDVTHSPTRPGWVQPADGAEIGAGLCALACLYAVSRHFKIKGIRQSLVPTS